MKKKATAKEKKAFARRFSLERWMELCGNDAFCAAFDSGDLELAALIGQPLNTMKNLSNVTALHREAHKAKYDPGAYARACLKGRAWSASPRALAQAAFINRHDTLCAWHGPKNRLP